MLPKLTDSIPDNACGDMIPADLCKLSNDSIYMCSHCLLDKLSLIDSEFEDREERPLVQLIKLLEVTEDGAN
jgi:hypothetical protein